MFKQLYLAMMAKIMTDPTFKYVDLFNHQYTPDAEGQIDPFPRPAVFIEFSPMNFDQAGDRVQKSELSIRFHICSDDIVNESSSLEKTDFLNAGLIHLDLVDSFQKLMTGFSTENCNAFSRTVLEMENYGTNVYTHIATYHTMITDTTAQPNWITKKVNPGNIDTQVNQNES